MSVIETFDDIVLGGGKGGKSLAMALGPAGHKVALIERGQIGGTCINVACIPTKTLVATAKLFDQIQHSRHFGIAISDAGPSLLTAIERKRRIVKGMVETHWKLFNSTPNMELIVGSGKFVGPRQIEVAMANGDRRLLAAKRIYINTGSRTTIPKIPGLADVPYLTSTSIMELNVLPDHLVIIGGGYIALEFAQIFQRLGSAVTVLLRGERFLPMEDEDIAEGVKEILEGDGIVFRSNAQAQSIKRNRDGEIEITIGGEEVISCSHVMVAIGRTPNTENLNLDATGVTLDERGNIKVNERLETEAENIWALGDCNGGPLFTHVSWDDYRIVKENVLHGANRTTSGRVVPYTLFIDPELGRVGLTEEQARKKGFDVLVAKIPASKVPRANTSGETKGVLKAVIDKKTNQILGCSLLCHSAGEVMSVVQMAMIGQVPYTAVRDTVFTHPTMAESLNVLLANL
ncbi:MAG: mercuric reductase [Candidatus Obscuribacterales bacterium]|nr:mercuric reductase [Candidatus Obscuribacterales bacterium]